jgi:hypothetical protein
MAMLVDFHLFVVFFLAVFGVVDLSFLSKFFSFPCLNCLADRFYFFAGCRRDQ